MYKEVYRSILSTLTHCRAVGELRARHGETSGLGGGLDAVDVWAAHDGSQSAARARVSMVGGRS